MLKPFTIGLFLITASATPALAQTDPASLPARDAHEGLLVAARPFADEAEYKSRYGKKNPHEAGIVAIEVYFRNDNDKPIRLDLESIRLVLAPPDVRRHRFGALAAEDVADRVLTKGGPNPTTSRVPIPIPGRGPKTGRGKDWNELVTALRSTAFEMDILPPKSTVHGVFFFDVAHRFDWLSYARLYIPDLKFMDSSKPLLFFEVDLAAASAH